MNLKLSENDLREPVHDLFHEDNYSLYNEVRLFSRSIDVVAKKRNTVISIELKLSDWKRAIEQASLDLRVSNYSYIALPEKKLSRIDRRMYLHVFNNGIGLISVDGNAKIIMKPVKSDKIQPKLRRNFLKSLRGSPYR